MLRYHYNHHHYDDDKNNDSNNETNDEGDIFDNKAINNFRADFSSNKASMWNGNRNLDAVVLFPWARDL